MWTFSKNSNKIINKEIKRIKTRNNVIFLGQISNPGISGNM